jgi:hypothetical protein
MKITRVAAAVVMAGALSQAAAVTDPPGDFLPLYEGPQNGDLDVLKSEVRYNGTSFVFDVMLNGLVGTTPGALYLWGINRGGAMGEAFPGIIDNVSFDWVLAVQPGAFAVTVDLAGPPGPPVPLADDAVVAAGNRLAVTVPASLLPSTGFGPSEYLVSFWPRSALTDLGNGAEISDFAPGTGMAGVSTVPEPGSALLVLFGGALALYWRRRRPAS